MSSPADNPLWPHQSKALQEIAAHIENGVRRILLTSPTGGGKSRIVFELILKYLREREWRSVVYSNRKMLVEQLRGSLAKAGLPVGVRAAGKHYDDSQPVQVSSLQTEDARVYKKKGYLGCWELFPAQLVFIDEAHLNSGREEDSVAARVKRDHHAAGAVIIEVTATPIDLDGKAEVMVVAGTNSELRKCGALVPATTYGPDEPDLRHIGLTEITKTDDLSEAQQKRAMGAVDKAGQANPKLQRLFGRVFEWYKVLNPDDRPTILFAPGVAESRWFAQEFTRQGVKAGHIDGQEVWMPGMGETFKSNDATRNELLEMSKDGTVRVLCNRFVLREGIDCPWLAHGIFATAFGSLQSYLQSGGRLLRSHPSLSSVTIQDHGGNWWRHGSLNADRVWPLGCAANRLRAQRDDDLREKKVKEPMRCPRCSAIMVSLRCVCGFVLDPRAKTRPVVQENGSLLLMEGDIFRPRRTEMRDDTLKVWERCYWRARKKDMTFRQAVGLFFHENGYWPPADLKNMPRDRDDQWRKVKDVPREALVGET